MAVDAPTLARLRLGARLRHLRTRASVTGEQAAKAIGASTSKVSRIEGGHVAARKPDVEALARLYDAVGELGDLLGLLRESGSQGYWQSFSDRLPQQVRHHLSLEAAAGIVRVYDAQAVPALLQVPAYTRALCGAIGDTGAWRAGLTAAALKRRRALLDAEGAPQVWALIGADVLSRAPAGDVAALLYQLEHLASGLRRDVAVQLVRSDAPANLGAPGPFSVLRFDGPGMPDLVLLEQLTNTVVLERDTEVDRYLEAFQWLAAEAMTPEESKAALAEARRELASSQRHRGEPHEVSGRQGPG